MLDIKFIRENADLIKEGARKKHLDVDVDALLSLDTLRRDLVTKVEETRARQNKVSEQIPSAAPEEKERLLAEMKVVKVTKEKIEDDLKKITREWQRLMVEIPNIPDMSVPEGACLRR